MSGQQRQPLATDILEHGERTWQTLRRAATLDRRRVRNPSGELFLDLSPARVLRYRAEAPSRLAPVLVIYSMINRPYLLDLQPRRSVIRGLTAAGADVYVLDWGEPSTLDRDLDMEECIGDFLPTVASAVRAAEGGATLNLMGICQGGTMAVCYAALHPETVRTLANFAAPVDFHATGNTLGRLVQDLDTARLDDVPGTLPSAAFNAVFVALKPLRLLDQRYFTMAELCPDDESLADFLRMERWMYDSPNQPTAAVRSFIRDFYQRNALYRGQLYIHGRRVDLAALTAPLFNAFALDDHLIPPEAARGLERSVGSTDIHSVPFQGGHLGLFVSSRAHREVYPVYREWLLRHGMSAGAAAEGAPRGPRRTGNRR